METRVSEPQVESRLGHLVDTAVPSCLPSRHPPHPMSAETAPSNHSTRSTVSQSNNYSTWSPSRHSKRTTAAPSHLLHVGDSSAIPATSCWRQQRHLIYSMWVTAAPSHLLHVGDSSAISSATYRRQQRHLIYSTWATEATSQLLHVGDRSAISSASYRRQQRHHIYSTWATATPSHMLHIGDNSAIFSLNRENSCVISSTTRGRQQRLGHNSTYSTILYNSTVLYNSTWLTSTFPL
jgi:hypothetical protein